MSRLTKIKRWFTPFRIISIAFALLILLGALILMTPIATKSGVVTPFNQTLFTATSAACVTGLIVQDTGSYWSVFGQVVIMLLIQIGGLGVVTFMAMIAMASNRRITLSQRTVLQEATSAPEIGGIVKFIKFSVILTLSIELLGAILMMPVFIKDFGAKGVWYAFFHSISAYCNAGFDILGSESAKYVSLTQYVNQPLINIAIMMLIVFGGLGFMTWKDIIKHKFRFKRYRMQSKVILLTTTILIVVPSLIFFFLDFKEMEIGTRIWASLFQAITPRTAGFNTVNLIEMSGTSQAIMIILMLIGGSPGSTAGGMKTTTLVVVVATLISTIRRKESPTLFKRTVEDSAIKQAISLFLMYIILFLFGGMIISIAEDLPLWMCLYESASAIGTVGLSVGITPKIGILSQLVLIALMFVGRVGALTLIYSAYSQPKSNLAKLPQEKINIG